MRGLGIRATSAAAVLAMTPVTVVTVVTLSEPAQAAPKKYSSCAKLHKDFKHGVSKSKQVAQKQVKQGYGMPSYSERAQKVYRANHANLDRDHDGTACEA